MRQNCKKLLGLLAVVALWLAAPTAARAAQPDAAPENSFYLYDEEYGYYDADNPPWAYYDWSDSAEAVYLEPYVSTFSSGDEITTEIESIDSYKITIPANVTWSDSSENKEKMFQMTGTLEPYRRLTVSVSSENKLTHGEQTLTCGEKTLGYTLTASGSDSNLTVESDNTTCKADTDASKKDFTANYKLAVTGTPTVSGEYTDKLTFLIECVPKTYTITYHINDGTTVDDTVVQTVECGTYALLEDGDIFSNPGWHFAGWSTTETVEQTVEAYNKDLFNPPFSDSEWMTTGEGENHNLYAQWGHLCTISATYEAADGTQDQMMGRLGVTQVVPDGAEYTWTRTIRHGSDDEKMWQETSYDFGTVTEDKTASIVVRRNLYYVILKGVLDGEGVEKENISEWGLARVLINGVEVAPGDSLYSYEHPYGSTIEVYVGPHEGYTVASYEYKYAGVDNGKHILTGEGYDTTRGAYYSSVIVHFKKATTGTQALLPGNDSLPVVDGELLPDDAAVYEPSDALADSTFDDSDSYWHDDTYYDDSFDAYSEPDYAPLVNPWADR